MSRGLNATFRNAIDNNSFRLATLIHFYFGAGEDLYYTDYGSDLVDLSDGDTYLKVRLSGGHIRHTRSWCSKV